MENCRTRQLSAEQTYPTTPIFIKLHNMQVHGHSYSRRLCYSHMAFVVLSYKFFASDTHAIMKWFRKHWMLFAAIKCQMWCCHHQQNTVDYDYTSTRLPNCTFVVQTIAVESEPFSNIQFI